MLQEECESGTRPPGCIISPEVSQGVLVTEAARVEALGLVEVSVLDNP